MDYFKRISKHEGHSKLCHLEILEGLCRRSKQQKYLSSDLYDKKEPKQFEQKGGVRKKSNANENNRGCQTNFIYKYTNRFVRYLTGLHISILKNRYDIIYSLISIIQLLFQKYT